MVKVLLGEDFIEEINVVCECVYGSKYFNEYKVEIVYFNDNDFEFYIDNKWMKFDNVGVLEVILKECFCEFMFEGKCWYDICLLGWDYVY